MARNKYDVDEELEVGFNKVYLKRIMAYAKPYRKTITINVGLMVIASVLSLVSPLLIQKSIDNYIPQGDIKGLVVASILFGIIIVATAVIMRYRLWTMGRVGQDIIVDIRKDLFDHLQKLPFSYFDNRPHGKILVRVVNYVNTLSDLLTNGIINLVADLVTLFVAIGFMFYLDVRLTLISLIGIPLLMFIILSLKNVQRRANRRLSSKQSNMNAYVHESINGIKVTQAFAREEMNKGIFKEVCEAYKKAWLHMVKLNFLVWPSIDLVSNICIALIYIVAILILGASVSVGVLVAFIVFVWRFWAPITNIGNLYNNIINAMAYLERIFEMLDEETVIDDKEDAIILPTIEGEVAFEDVTFMYEEDEPILEHMSFKVKKGHTVAIVGPTGAGKTTIVNLLSRFYNVNSGKVTIDGIDISTVTLKSLRQQVGVMLQDSFIFAGTIMDNIRYGRMDATDEEVIAAAKIVKAHEFIMKFEKGYQTEVNERGSRLSVGQRQLISFARVLLMNPRILILDEATSSIDTQTEMLLQQGLDELLKGRTAFVIAHRLSTIKNADEIFYIDQGKILERGTHEVLLAKQGYYYELYAVQNRLLIAQ